jgi:hypothetical protein
MNANSAATLFREREGIVPQGPQGGLPEEASLVVVFAGPECQRIPLEPFTEPMLADRNPVGSQNVVSHLGRFTSALLLGRAVLRMGDLGAHLVGRLVEDLF